MTKKYRTYDEAEAEYYRNNPDEIDGYLNTCFSQYAKDRATGALLNSLRMIARVKGVTTTAEAAGLSRKGRQKALSNDGNPHFENVCSIMQVMGYLLTPQRISM